MAITVRKGSEVQFDINKMLPGEFAVTTDTHKVFVCTSAGHTRELASVEELQQILDVSDEAFVAFQELINAMESNDVITGLLNDIEKLKEDIKKNNGFKELTKAEYEALSEEEKNSGTLYLITDDTDEYKAGLIEYNNANSGLTAKDVQGAIDEVSAETDELNLNMLKIKKLSLTGAATKDTKLELKFEWGLPSGSQKISTFLNNVSGSSYTQGIYFCNFISADTVRIMSDRDQNVTVNASVIYK